MASYFTLLRSASVSRPALSSMKGVCHKLTTPNLDAKPSILAFSNACRCAGCDRSLCKAFDSRPASTWLHPDLSGKNPCFECLNLLHQLLKSGNQFIHGLFLAFPDIIRHTGADMIRQQNFIKAV